MEQINLRPYQQEDVALMTKARRFYNTNEQGLGKTLEILTAIDNLNGWDYFLVVCTKGAIGTWRDEIKKWYGYDAIMYLGDQKKRRKLLQKFCVSTPHIIITNFSLAKELMVSGYKWKTIVADEIHNSGLFNPKSDTFKLFDKYAICENMFLTTGTPIKKGLENLFAPLHLLDKVAFPNYWPFVNKYLKVIQGPFGKEIEPMPKNPEAFRKILSNYMIRHRKVDVAKDLPEKQRQVISIEVSPTQRAIIDSIREQQLVPSASEDGVPIPILSGATGVLYEREVLVTPRLFGYDENGAAIDTLVEMAENEFMSGRSIIVCTPFRQAIPFIEQALRPLATTFVIHGQIKELPRDVANRFQECKTTRKALIFTIKSGASFNAYSASTAFFLGYEWSAAENKQAEDRIHRIGQTNPVMIYYLLNSRTVDELVKSKLNTKQTAEDWAFDPNAIKEMYEHWEKKYCGQKF